MLTTTRTHDIISDGLCIRLTIEEDIGPREEGFPHGTIEAGRVIAAEVLEVVDEEKAYRNLAELRRA